MKLNLLTALIFSTLVSFGQGDTIVFNHNGYRFHANVDSIIKQLWIAKDSVDYYSQKLKDINTNSGGYSSDSTLRVGSLTLKFDDLLMMFETDQRTVRITKDGQPVNYKVKTYFVPLRPQSGIGESGGHFMLIIDKKKRGEIIRISTGFSLMC